MRAALLTLVLALPASAAEHPGPPAWINVEVTDEVIHYLLVGEQPLLVPWLDLGELRLPFPIDDEGRERVRAAAEAYFEGWDAVRAGGRRLPYEVTDVLTEEGAGFGLPNLMIRLEFPLEEPVTRVDFTWRSFDGIVDNGAETEEMNVLVKWGREVEMYRFSLEEPGFTWHLDPDSRPKRDYVVEAVTGAAPSGETLPAASIGALVGALVLTALAVLKRAPAAIRLGAPFAGLLAAAALWDVGRVESPWREQVVVPTPEQARELFGTLHRNIYAAFDEGTEDGIYDTLAVSVDAALLDDLYGEIYESLVLRGEGGAVCEIEEVDVLGGEVAFPEQPEDAPPRFDVDWSWSVHGVVSHWGHTHRRTNQYRATYAVRHDGTSWKIAAVDVTEHERIDDEGETEY